MSEIEEVKKAEKKELTLEEKEKLIRDFLNKKNSKVQVVRNEIKSAEYSELNKKRKEARSRMLQRMEEIKPQLATKPMMWLFDYVTQKGVSADENSYNPNNDLIMNEIEAYLFAQKLDFTLDKFKEIVSGIAVDENNITHVNNEVINKILTDEKFWDWHNKWLKQSKTEQKGVEDKELTVEDKKQIIINFLNVKNTDLIYKMSKIKAFEDNKNKTSELSGKAREEMLPDAQRIKKQLFTAPMMDAFTEEMKKYMSANSSTFNLGEGMSILVDMDAYLLAQKLDFPVEQLNEIYLDNRTEYSNRKFIRSKVFEDKKYCEWHNKRLKEEEAKQQANAEAEGQKQPGE